MSILSLEGEMEAKKNGILQVEPKAQFGHSYPPYRAFSQTKNTFILCRNVREKMVSWFREETTLLE